MKDKIADRVVVIVLGLALCLYGFVFVRVHAQNVELTEAQKSAVWNLKAGEVNIAFRDGGAAFDAVTLTLDTLRQSNPTAAQTLARDIARNLGVIGGTRELGDDAIEDRKAFREFAATVQSLPFSEADREAIIDLAKSKSVLVSP